MCCLLCDAQAAARIALFIRILAILLVALFIISTFNIAPINVGKLWMVGTACALYVQYRLTSFRRAPDGVMAFCRSMGQAEVEEYMFSYSWKVEPENIRTLAKVTAVRWWAVPLL